METKLNSIKLAIHALNEYADRLDSKVDYDENKMLQYAEELENCRVAIEDMKRLQEQCEFEHAMDKFLYEDDFVECVDS